MSYKYILPKNKTGILYPSWVTYNYKKYKIENIPHDPNKDMCANADKLAGDMKARTYQKFLQKYMRAENPFKSILIYHGLGVGKTATSIYIYNILYNSSSTMNVYIFIKKSLYKGWMDELHKFLDKKDKDKRLKNIQFINYDSSTANIRFKEMLLEKQNVGKNNLYIIDEVHNFIRNVYSNIKNQESVRAIEIYEHIKRDLANVEATKLVCISGTPVINRPFELGLLFNLLRKDIFPSKEDEFNNIFLKNPYSQSINQTSKNLFQRRILGLVSYYEFFHKGLFASKEEQRIELNMTKYQEKVYKYYEDIEDKLSKNKQKFGNTKSKNDMFMAYTRQSCNFVFPFINKTINGENRPRPNMYRKSLKKIDQDIRRLERNKLKVKNNNVQNVMKIYQTECKKYIATLIEFWSKLKKSDDTILKTILTELNKNKQLDLKEFIKVNITKSKLLESMYECSPKILYMCFNIIHTIGNALVYTNYVNMEGLQIIKVYFLFLGINKYGEYHGGIPDHIKREQTRNIFNSIDNKNGDIMNIILISPAMTEGVNLSNVRQVHILEPHWNDVRIKQIIGRSIRQCSHRDLPISDRHVMIYRYFVKRTSDKITTDQKINEIASNKSIVLDSFLLAMKESAIDCELFKDVNKSYQDYSCFKFGNEELLSKELGYGYINNIYEDNIKENKGLNSINYDKKTIQTYKIKAIKINHTDIKEYWYHEKTGYVYDIDVDVLIGKVKKDKYNIPEMKDMNIYIISELSQLDKYKLDKNII